jgi:putative SOS response-associated peptidase YedK
MPLILAPGDYDRWLGEEVDPSDLIRPSPAEEMTAWPVSPRVNKADNEDTSLLDPVEAAA